jgi:hypothetical protein
MFNIARCVTPMDFFLWGYVKNSVCQININDLRHLKARIWDAVATVTLNMLQATWNEVKYIVWIFVAPPRKPPLKFIEKNMYSTASVV